MRPGLGRGLAYGIPMAIVFWIVVIILLRMIFA